MRCLDYRPDGRERVSAVNLRGLYLVTERRNSIHFAAGFYGVPDYQTSYHQEIIIEADGFNNTLAPWNACPNSNDAVAGDLGGYASGNWTNVYLNATVARLQQYVTGINLTTSDLYAMQQMCAYETVALGYSQFCGLFTEEEWRGFDYSIGESQCLPALASGTDGRTS